MAALTFEEIMESVPLLSEADRWRLLMEVARTVPKVGAKKSVTDFFGVLPPGAESPDERVRRLRDEWER